MKIAHRYAALSTICLMFFIDFMSIGLVYPMFSAMLFNPNNTLVTPETSQTMRGLLLGIILALMPLAQFFSSPILGTLSDRIGRKPLLLISIASGILGDFIALTGVWYKNIMLLAFSRIVIGLAAGNEAIGAAATADISSNPEEKTKNFGLIHMAGGLGFTVGPFLGGQLSAMNLGIFSGYALPFLCAGLLSTINFITVIIFFKETHKRSNKQTDFVFGFTNIKKVWYMSEFFLLFLAIFLYNTGWAFYWDFIPTDWIKSYNFNATNIGNMYAWGSVIYAFSAGLFIRPIIEKFKTEKILFYALLGESVFIALPIIFSSSWMYWIYVPIQQYLIALIFPTTYALISNKSSQEIQGEMMGILQSVQSLSYIASPLIAGPLLGITTKMPLIIGSCTLIGAAYVLSHAQKNQT
jgi:DHA1 family tetracycline resistance protein-like MFS transporter